MRKKVTSTDIAKAVGVSQATVSMVLNKKYNVSFSRETVEKVEQAARELGYVLPKRRSTKNSKNSRLIVVFCPTLTNPYYVMMLCCFRESRQWLRRRDTGYLPAIPREN